MTKRFLSLFLLLACVFSGQAKSPIFNTKQINSPPPRIIRTCCSFGYDVKVFMLPGVKVTDITAPDLLGKHVYLGNPEENNGIIYTKNGGFIDLGHLRDQADWTAFLFSQLKKQQGKGQQEIKLGREGGAKVLQYSVPSWMTAVEIAEVAGRIAYDLSVWHEIATWYGASSVPFIPERYSSFSVEDAYSNLLGTKLGIDALMSDLPYEEAMTELIENILHNLEAVQTIDATKAAMLAVDEVWWNKEKALPLRGVLAERQMNVYGEIMPITLSSEATLNNDFNINVTEKIGLNEISDYYSLLFKLNGKFPYKKIFPLSEEKNRTITQEDFPAMLTNIEEKIDRIDLRKREHAEVLSQQ